MTRGSKQIGATTATVAANIRSAMGYKGWKAPKLAEATGLNPVTLRAQLRAAKVITVEELKTIADALEVPVSQLVKGT